MRFRRRSLPVGTVNTGGGSYQSKELGMIAGSSEVANSACGFRDPTNSNQTHKSPGGG